MQQLRGLRALARFTGAAASDSLLLARSFASSGPALARPEGGAGGARSSHAGGEGSRKQGGNSYNKNNRNNQHAGQQRSGGGSSGASAAAAPAAKAAPAAPAAPAAAAPAPKRAAPTRPSYQAFVDRDGDVIPLHDADEKHAQAPTMSVEALLDPVQEDRAARTFQYYRRQLREQYEEEDMESYSTAKILEEGSDLDPVDLEDVVRPNDYKPGEDPLLDKAGLPFNASALKFTTNLSWHSLPGERGIDRRAKLECFVAKLGLTAPVQQYVRAIAGAHYNPTNDLLKIAVDKHTDAALNKREALEQLVATVQAAQKLAEQHGAFHKVKQMPAYSH